MKKLLAAFLVINLVFSSFSTVYASVDSNKGEVRNKAQVTFKQRKYLNVSLADTKHFKVSSYQQFYSALDSAIKNVDSSIFITMENGYLQDDIGGFGKVLEKISDFAGVGSFVDSYTYSSSSTGLSGYLVEINYARNIEDVRAKTKEVNNEVDRIVSNITSSKAGDYNNIKAIHDYIVNNTRYDIDRINNLPIESHTAYGVLISKVGVCDGYAISMKKMLDKIDIPNIVVVGTSAGVGHAWNIVKLNGKWQHVDSTWDDPIYRKNGNIVQIIRYDYFLKSDEYMKKDHIWNTANYPKDLEVDLKTKVGVKYNRKLIVKK